ncbi:hypothetical protein BLNAU_13829 [Blattamonas nauphoetae]|uniref:Uncharacterized protein n=1 Tax=Blattamonas nauphoetae TaxID=2049346 RepID=A0ABQ9XIQ9_9EUKA|nr:hypothetical protein BLNAU_13829 [Blattamonas nauphoetae]
MTTVITNKSISIDSPCPDCSLLMNWTENYPKSEHEQAVVFRSLVATLKCKPALDVSLETKAVKLLETVTPWSRKSADVFLRSLGRTADESLTEFVQSVLVIISTANKVITTAAMKMLKTLIRTRSPKGRLTLVKADLIPRLINTLNPLSLSLAESVDIHASLMTSITFFLWLSTPDALSQLEVKAGDEQPDVRETVFQQVLAPSEKYVRHLCVNRYSIVDGDQSLNFLLLLAHFLRISVKSDDP